MTRAEIVTELKSAGIPFDARANKATLLEIYEQNFDNVDRTPITPLQDPPDDNLLEIEPEYEIDADGEFILDGEGNKIEIPTPEHTVLSEGDELFKRIEGAEAPQDRPPQGERPLFEQKKRKIPT